jgi:hypothetical protein
MRPVVNLGSASTATFKVPLSSRGAAGAARGAARGGPAAAAVGSGQRARRHEVVTLSFRPVNLVLQNVFQALKAEAGREEATLQVGAS